MALVSIKRFSLPFTRYKNLPIFVLLVVVAAFFTGLLGRGINWGVDFHGGLMIEAQLSQPADTAALRKALKTLTTKEFILQELGAAKDAILLRCEQEADPQAFIQKIKPALGTDVVIRKIESIGPKVGGELIRNGLYAILCALVGMMAFVAFRFEWQFSVCSLAALVHDCAGILAFFMLTGLEFNEGAIVAILITASYSINDTVVIFDRLRENLNKGLSFDAAKIMDKTVDKPLAGGKDQNPEKKSQMILTQLLNLSLNETFGRTLLTCSTALLALFMMYLFGGEVIAAFSLPILVGIVIGAYSSVFVAAPLLRFLPTPKSFGLVKVVQARAVNAS